MYAGGNFNIDTSTNVADLIALKDSAPASDDASFLSAALRTVKREVAGE